MKTRLSKLSAGMILPAALLLCQCASTDGIPPKNVTAVPISTSHWMQISSGLLLFDPSGSVGSGTWSAPGENEAQPFPAEDRDKGFASAPDVVVLPPLIVTDTLKSVLLAGMRYWPADVVDAEEKKAWIPVEQPARLYHDPRDDGGCGNIRISYPNR